MLLSSLICHHLLTSSLSTLKLVKPLGLYTVTSIRMLFLKLFSFYIDLWSFPFLPTAPLSGTHHFLLSILKFSGKKQQFALKMCSHKWDNDYPSHLSTLNLLLLSTCCSLSKLCLFYKINNNLVCVWAQITPTNWPQACNFYIQPNWKHNLLIDST